MKIRLSIAALVLVPAGAALAWSSSAQDKKAADAAAPKDDPSMMKMMEFARVGPHHKVLDARVGTWSVEVKMFMPDGKVETTHGTSKVSWIMDGRFVQDSFAGEFMGQPFQGEGRIGYDNLKKKYVSTWLDTAGTGIYYSEGTYDANTKTFRFAGEMPDTDAGKYVKSRAVETWHGADHYVVESFMPGPDGKEFKNMELHCKRAK